MNHRVASRHAASSVAAAAFVCAAHAAALAQTGMPSPATMPIDELKRSYLHCDRVSSHRVMDAGSAAFCSHVSEQLRLRGFDGSFDRLIAWWRTQRHASVPPHAPGSAAD